MAENNQKDQEESFLASVREHFQKTEGLENIKCNLRLKIWKFIHDGEATPTNPVRDNKNSSIQLLNYMIQEYFEWMCYTYSLDMFTTEIGNPEKVSREYLETRLKAKSKKQFEEGAPVLLQIIMKSMIPSFIESEK